jgi:hypothetical protein
VEIVDDRPGEMRAGGKRGPARDYARVGAWMQRMSP